MYAGGPDPCAQPGDRRFQRGGHRAYLAQGAHPERDLRSGRRRHQRRARDHRAWRRRRGALPRGRRQRQPAGGTARARPGPPAPGPHRGQHAHQLHGARNQNRSRIPLRRQRAGAETLGTGGLPRSRAHHRLSLPGGERQPAGRRAAGLFRADRAYRGGTRRPLRPRQLRRWPRQDARRRTGLPGQTEPQRTGDAGRSRTGGDGDRRRGV